ncbi:MAG TPA: DNA mismatch repair protein MutT, partial [Niabella sp.]
SLIDIKKYRESISTAYQAQWFSIKDYPELIFDHADMVKMAQKRLQYKATSHAILFELLPDKFTIPLLQSLFEDVYETSFDKGNFSRKMLSTGLLQKQKDKDKTGSKKGAFFYKLDKKNYQQNLHKFLKLVPNPNSLI